MKVDIKKLKCHKGEINQVLKECKDILGEDFEITISKNGTRVKAIKGAIDDTDIILTALYATYLLLIIDHYDELTKISKYMLDNQFESFGEMLK